MPNTVDGDALACLLADEAQDRQDSLTLNDLQAILEKAAQDKFAEVLIDLDKNFPD
jgi:hypothetical protein